MSPPHYPSDLSDQKSGPSSNRCSRRPRSAAVRRSGRRGTSRTPSSICSGAGVRGGCCRASIRPGRRSTTTFPQVEDRRPAAPSPRPSSRGGARVGRARPSPQRGGDRQPGRKDHPPVGGPERGYDGAKRLAARKRHILVDTGGLVLAAKVHGADLPDRDGGRRLLEDGEELPRMGLFSGRTEPTRAGSASGCGAGWGGVWKCPITPTGSCGARVWRKSPEAFRCCLAVGSWSGPSRGWACRGGLARTTSACRRRRRR